MPVDAEGNIADIVMDPNATISRMIIGRLYEQYICASSRDTHKLICKRLGIAPFSGLEESVDYVSRLSADVKDHAWDLLLNFYRITNPDVFGWFKEGKVKCNPDEYLGEIIHKGIYLYMPTENKPENTDIVKQLENSTYRPCYGPVTYVGNSGKKVTTKEKVRIGSMYFILLEKIGDDWSAVSSGKLQHFGVLAQLTKQDKFAKPARMQAVRGAGEAEVRIYASYIGGEFVAEMMDRTNNPKTHREMVYNLLKADQPGNVHNLVDREKIPFGNSKPLVLVKHILSCGGLEFAYKPYKPNWVK